MKVRMQRKLTSCWSFKVRVTGNFWGQLTLGGSIHPLDHLWEQLSMDSGRLPPTSLSFPSDSSPCSSMASKLIVRCPAAQLARCFFRERKHEKAANEVSRTGEAKRIADLAVLEPLHNWMLLNRKESFHGVKAGSLKSTYHLKINAGWVLIPKCVRRPEEEGFPGMGFGKSIKMKWDSSVRNEEKCKV